MTKKTKSAFLTQALANIPFDGWTSKMIHTTASQIGWTDYETRKNFPGGVKDLLTFFDRWINEQLIQQTKTVKLQDMKVRDRITWLVRTRLEILTPYKDSLRQALGFSLLPQHSFTPPKAIWEQANLMWYEAGDTATDYNHYTKRGLLSGVIASTTLFWLNDTSDNHEKTWSFLDRRIENVLKVGGTIGKMAKSFSRFFPFQSRLEKQV